MTQDPRIAAVKAATVKAQNSIEDESFADRDARIFLARLDAAGDGCGPVDTATGCLEAPARALAAALEPSK